MNITDLCDDLLEMVSKEVSANPRYKYRKTVHELQDVISKTQVYIPLLLGHVEQGSDSEHHTGVPFLTKCFLDGELPDYDIDGFVHYDPVEDWMDRSITRKWGWKSVDILKRWYMAPNTDEYDFTRRISYYYVDQDEYILGSKWYDYMTYTYPEGYLYLLCDKKSLSHKYEDLLQE